MNRPVENNHTPDIDAGLPAGLRAPSELSHGELTKLLAAPDYTPEKLIDMFKRDGRIAELFKAPAVREGYTIEEHTLMVLRQFEKYFSEVEMPEGITRAEMRLLLALHDIGKGIPSNRGEQHDFTLSVLEELEQKGVLSEQAFKLIAAPLSMDSVGHFLYHSTVNGATPEEKLLLAQEMPNGPLSIKQLQEFVGDVRMEPLERIVELADKAAAEIHQMAEKGEMTPAQVFDILLVYYQCDTLAYTYDAARDKGRSPVLGEEVLESVKFNHDKPLEQLPGLQLEFEGETSAQVYARLEAASDYSRGYPSLDFLYELNPNFDPTESPLTSQQFMVLNTNNRVKFCGPMGAAILLLETQVKSKK